MYKLISKLRQHKMKKYKAMVLSCMDPRFQTKVSNYLKKKINWQI